MIPPGAGARHSEVSSAQVVLVPFMLPYSVFNPPQKSANP
jgi:hypothetical protein